jgi:hypothetical protein
MGLVIPKPRDRMCKRTTEATGRAGVLRSAAWHEAKAAMVLMRP